MALGTRCCDMQQASLGDFRIIRDTDIFIMAELLGILPGTTIASQDDDVELQSLDAMHGGQSNACFRRIIRRAVIQPETGYTALPQGECQCIQIFIGAGRDTDAPGLDVIGFAMLNYRQDVLHVLLQGS